MAIIVICHAMARQLIGSCDLFSGWRNCHMLLRHCDLDRRANEVLECSLCAWADCERLGDDYSDADQLATLVSRAHRVGFARVCKGGLDQRPCRPPSQSERLELDGDWTVSTVSAERDPALLR